MIGNVGEELNKNIHDFIIAKRFRLLVKLNELINVMIPPSYEKRVFGHL